MTEPIEKPAEQPVTTQEPPEPTVDRAQYLVCAVLVLVGAFIIYDALNLPGASPRWIPLGHGCSR